MAKKIDGKAVSAALRCKITKEVAELTESGIKPGLAVILVGDDPASAVYVRNKKKACAEVGIESFEYRLDASTTNEQLLELIDELNARADVDGILCQLPLPKHLDEAAVIDRISPEKDVDCFHKINVGKTMLGEKGFLPCTPAGVMELLKYYEIPIEGKECVIVGRSNIVGKPQALLMLRENATVTVCHSRTKELDKICKRADILVAAIGKAKFITADMVKDEAVVVDVGMNRDENGKLCGDVDFEGVEAKASYITPVPGGVGPMTITMLLENTLTAAKQRRGLK